MPFTISAISAKDGASNPISGGLLAGDVAGGGAGPWFLFHGLVDGVAGVNKAQIDSSNRLAVLAAQTPITPVVSVALESSHVIKGSAGTLFDWHVTTVGVAGYVMIFNAASAPADGAVTPVECYAVAADNSISRGDRLAPSSFSTGITMVFSTTGPFTKTASSSAFFSAKAT